MRADAVGIDLADACAKVLAVKEIAEESLLAPDSGLGGISGQARACGGRPAIAAIDPAAGARVAIAEALTGIAGSVTVSMPEVALALSWPGGGQAEQEETAARSAADEFLSELGIVTAGGEDPLPTGAARGRSAGAQSESPPSAACIAAASGPLDDVLPSGLTGAEDSIIMRLSTAAAPALAASALADCYDLGGSDVPYVDANAMLAWWETVRGLRSEKLVRSYRGIGRGGMLVAAAGMCLDSGSGMTLVLDSLCQPAMGLDADGCEMSSDATAPGGMARIAAELFCEQPGALVEIGRGDAERAVEIAGDSSFPGGAAAVGWPRGDGRLLVLRNEEAVIDERLEGLRGSGPL